MIGWCRALCLLLPLLLGARAALAVPERIVLPLLVHMAREEGRDVADRSFLEVQLARANKIFASHGVGFRMEVVASPAGPRAESRSDRNALAVHVKPHVINCFVVASLLDVDEPGRVRRGVHWHAPGARAPHYVILSAISEPDVLAHELGHFLGNPRHSETPGNLMSYERGAELPFLDAEQVRRVRRAVRAYVRRGELRPLSAD